MTKPHLLQLVYPIAKRVLGPLDSRGELVREMRADHSKLRRQLRQLGSVSEQGDKRWGAALAELSQDLQHHLRHEESHLFPLLARALQPSVARRLLLLVGMRLLGPLASLVRP
jgi:iron-sulfur cluster repair protein YtfE (RIC family)